MVDQSKLEMLISFGFQEEIARKALKASVIFFSSLIRYLLAGGNCSTHFLTFVINLHMYDTHV